MDPSKDYRGKQCLLEQLLKQPIKEHQYCKSRYKIELANMFVKKMSIGVNGFCYQESNFISLALHLIYF